MRGGNDLRQTPLRGSTAEPSSDWFSEEECGLAVSSIPNTSPSGVAREAWSCLRGPSRGRKPRASLHGRIYGVSAGTGCRPRARRLLASDGPPFRWDEDRRFLIRAELDAAFFHLYLPADANGDWIPARKVDGCPYEETPEQLAELKKSFPKPRDAVDYIMDTFPIVKRKDEAAYGSYRTKEMILSIYDEMQEAVGAGGSYRPGSVRSRGAGSVVIRRVQQRCTERVT